ncbi:ABC transporter ATP-binding protein [Geomonas paludis]|uniref:ABC transporter ATP-binding protein n=1 Tax=Geomonas paludis TaxID=2740185 RepID=A0A6V8MXG2_9BACT|nr:ABC transporter ATP-binding protein [Geomonas paludis]UPU37102.1 ABC transporter ATP-binding protein [Geomonas paludis]GFO64801.1 teichoic acid ABC transporter ATP-binding protein [Geomonas paludis]
MHNPIIKIRNLSKVYKLYDSPTERLKEALHPFGKKYHREFYALQGIDLDVASGETIGLIGPNGAGKSTLLKAITGVIAPTTGSVEVTGKISALLELGAGFNPDISGLENVYFNGAILGFSRDAMDRKLDEILSFADIGDFIHQPVKTYSSGMMVRLAFAVAASVEPDILIVDEALSVGDSRFKQKCLRKINEFIDKGVTVLFVSHDMASIKTFCRKAIWIGNGKIVEMGDSKEVCKRFANFMAYDMVPTQIQADAAAASGAPASYQWQDVAGCASVGDRSAIITRVAFFNSETEEPAELLEGGEPVAFVMELQVKEPVLQPILSIDIKNSLGILIFGVNSFFLEKEIPEMAAGEAHVVKFSFRLPYLKNGNYSLTAAVADGTYHSHVQNHIVHEAVTFQIANRDLQFRHYTVVNKECDIEYDRIR